MLEAGRLEKLSAINNKKEICVYNNLLNAINYIPANFILQQQERSKFTMKHLNKSPDFIILIFFLCFSIPFRISQTFER